MKKRDFLLSKDSLKKGVNVLINSLDECNKLACQFSKIIGDDCIVLLDGDLGAGKTSFVRFFMQCRGVTKNITSPTYTFLKTYKTDKDVFFHYDLYRVESIEEVYELGISEYLFVKGIAFIEWSLFKELPNKKIYNIKIKNLGNTKREFFIKESEYSIS